MRNFITIWRREMMSCFLSPVAYVVMVVFLATSSALFLLQVFEGNPESGEPLSSPLIAVLILLLPVLVTVVCMRLFAAEKRSGTIEQLMTAPVTEVEVVLGKYFGAWVFLLMVSAPALTSLFLLVAMSPGLVLEHIDTGAVLGGCLIFLLFSAMWTSIGLLFSLLTKNQIVAAICIFCVVWLTLLLGWLLSFVSSVPVYILQYLAAEDHLLDFARGVIDTRPIVFCVSSTVFMLFTSVKVLELKKW